HLPARGIAVRVPLTRPRREGGRCRTVRTGIARKQACGTGGPTGTRTHRRGTRWAHAAQLRVGIATGRRAVRWARVACPSRVPFCSALPCDRRVKLQFIPDSWQGIGRTCYWRECSHEGTLRNPSTAHERTVVTNRERSHLRRLLGNLLLAGTSLM